VNIQPSASLVTVQYAIALMLVGTFCIVVLALTIGPLLLGEKHAEAHEFLKTFFAYGSGFVGIVIGYLFGRGTTSAA
jgi:hypothetical protein